MFVLVAVRGANTDGSFLRCRGMCAVTHPKQPGFCSGLNNWPRPNFRSVKLRVVRALGGRPFFVRRAIR
jgi:hypothetical protein